MNHIAKPLHFFLGANTPQGFVSRFDQLADPLDGWREFVIKGGPGTGKSTLMKRIANQAEKHCEHIELIHCSSDADSLDGVILHDVKTSIADGTSPHAKVRIITKNEGERPFFFILPADSRTICVGKNDVQTTG